MQPPVVPQRPLTPLAKAGLLFALAGVVLLFYLFVLLALTLVGALLLVEVVVFVILLRFGLASFLLAILQEHARLAAMIPRSLWLRSDATVYGIVLKAADAPGLFKMVDQLSARFEVRSPDSIFMQHGVVAHVNLKGYRAGAGTTELHLGFDLLAALNVTEIEGIIAHEMAHAKLVQRGFRQFVFGALARCGTLAGRFSGEVQAGRHTGSPRAIAGWLLAPTHALTREMYRLVAAYSRQDEFEADRAAAELCGSAPFIATLQKFPAIVETSNRLPWRERVAQLQTGESFSAWFIREIEQGLQSPRPAEKEANLFDKYSTHPSDEDRIAALPPDAAPHEANGASGLTLLAAPDVSIEKLVAEIQRVSAVQEEKDSRALARWTSRSSFRSALRPLQLLALAIWILALILGVASASNHQWTLVAAWSGAFGAGWALYRAGRYRDKTALPIPEFGVFMHAREKPFDFEKQTEIETELTRAIGAARKKKAKCALLIQEAHKALEKCDYLRAHVAARTCFKVNPKSVEAHLVFAIAAAAVYQYREAGSALRFVRYQTAFVSPSAAWGSAWALMLLQDWAAAEALLDLPLARNPGNKTLLSCLALCRANRGKINGAIAKSREACTPTPPDKDHATLLVSMLIESGLLREASARLAPLQAFAETDPDVQMLLVRLKLLTRSFEEADHWAGRLRNGELKPARLLELAQIYHRSRRFDPAMAMYLEVLQKGHFPAAVLGMAQIEIERREKGNARHDLMRALNLKTPLADGALGPLPLFHAIVAALNSLNEPAICSAWQIKLPSTGRYHEGLSNTVYLVYAVDESAALQHVVEVLTAMEPEFKPTDLVWERAPRDLQPDRPVRPGIQNVVVLPSNRPVLRKR